MLSGALRRNVVTATQPRRTSPHSSALSIAFPPSAGTTASAAPDSAYLRIALTRQ